MSRIYSYVVRYDSGFAPNPFYGYCTLATCKPQIRERAVIGDWIIGCASNDRSLRRGGHLVYVMRISETMSFDEYNMDIRFAPKKPFRTGSRKQSCGDNIYYRSSPESDWSQRDSFHSHENGTINRQHMERDTGVNRILISNDFIYFGGEGPLIQGMFQDQYGRPLCIKGRGMACFDDPQLIEKLERWVRERGIRGFQGPPQEWISLRD